MEKITFKILLFSFLILFISCNDDEPTYEKKTVDNIELIEALKTKGLSFEGNLIVLNDKVAEIKSLDLSGSKLTDVSGLELFPNLEEINLANNKLGHQFDFTKLPKAIKRIDLSDNKIYDYKGLIEVDFKTSKMKVLRKLEKIALPASARFNMEALPYYSQKSKETKLTMQNTKTGKAEPYTTLREIPDNVLRDYLTLNFSSLINKDGKLDISKKITTEQEITSLKIDMTFYYEPVSGPVDVTKVTNLDGVEYIINNPFYKGTSIFIKPPKGKEFTINYLKPSKSLEQIFFTNIHTPLIDWSTSQHMRTISFERNKYIEAVDLKNSKYFMQKEGGYNPSDQVVDAIRLYDCPSLKSLTFPKTTPTPIFAIELYKLPNLNKLDMTNISGISQFYLAELPKIESLALSSIKHSVNLYNGVLNDPNMGIWFSISKDIMNIKGVKDFIIRLGKQNKITNYGVNALSSRLPHFDYPYKDKVYDYTSLYTIKSKSAEQPNDIILSPISIEELIKRRIEKQNKKK